MYSNLHTHSKFCDGKSELSEHIAEAKKLKMKTLGFSSHAPLHIETEWTIAGLTKLQEYIFEVESLKKQNSEYINIFSGLEADYIPNITKNLHETKQDNKLDYIIGAIHLVKNSDNQKLWFIDGPEENFISGLETVFNNDIKKGVEAYFFQMFEMLETQKFDILAHFDKIKLNNANRFFNEDDKWYKDFIEETLLLIKKYDIIMEINTRGFYKKKRTDFFPSNDIIKKAKSQNINMIVNSDAHCSAELISGYAEAFSFLKEIGIKEQMQLTSEGWSTINI